MLRFASRFLPFVFAAAVALPAAAADGDIDPTFGRGGVSLISLDGVEGHELRAFDSLTLPDGKLLFAGSRNFRILGNPDPNMRPMLARLNADGSADTTFGSDPANPGILVLPSVSPTAIQRIEAVRRLDDGSIIVAGSAFAIGPVSGWVEKMDADGNPDASFGDAGRVAIASTYVHGLEVDSQGRFVIAGERLVHLDGDPANTLRGYRGYVARLNPDGRFDASFGPNDDGSVLLDTDVQDDNVYVAGMALDGADGVYVGGTYEDNVTPLSQFSLVHLDADGRLDSAFAGGGWRRFAMAGDASIANGIDALAANPAGGVTFVGHRDAGDYTTTLAIGQVDALGADDDRFGDAATPGYQSLSVPASAYYRNAVELRRQDDGKWLVGVSYAGEDKEDFLAARVLADGSLDAAFGEGGVVDLDLVPDGGAYNDLMTITLQNGQPILAGIVKQDPSSLFAPLGVVRLLGGTGGDDTIFKDGFDTATPPSGIVSTYDDLPEGFLGESYTYNGITYHDANGIGGVFPDGSTFVPADVGSKFTIENAGYYFDDYPDWGSSPNVLTFGDVYMPGENFSIGPLVRASMDLDAPARAVSLQMVYYEHGPWGGIEIHLDAFSKGQLVGSDMVTLADGGDRDNLTSHMLSIAGVEFDALKLYATYDGQPSAPRVMIDNLDVVPAK